MYEPEQIVQDLQKTLRSESDLGDLLQQGVDPHVDTHPGLRRVGTSVTRIASPR